MGASYTFADNTANFANVAAQTKFNNTNAPEVAIKARVKGDFWTKLASYQQRLLTTMPSRDGLLVYGRQADPGDYRLGFYSGNQGFIEYQLTSFSPVAGTYYVVYAQYCATANGGIQGAIGDAAGSLVLTTSSTISGTLGGSTGELSIGPSDTAKGFTLDGIAFYSAPLSGAARFSTPASGDSNLIALYKFDEGTGTSVADATGGTSLTIAGSGTWNAGDGAWDGSAGGKYRPYFITG